MHPRCNFRYVFQEEVAPDTGTPHLQGFVYHKNQVAVSTIKQWNPRLHWEAARSVFNSVAYCSDAAKRKPLGRVWSEGYQLPPEPTIYTIDEADLYQWQKELLVELRAPPDERRITWYSDAIGGSGKTAFAKFIMTTFPGSLFFSGGKFADMAYQVIRAKKDPAIIVINLPRTADGKVSYSAIESMKDGIIQSGKYEGGCRIYAPPHLVVFANFLPTVEALSLDRWDIRILEERRRTS